MSLAEDYRWAKKAIPVDLGEGVTMTFRKIFVPTAEERLVSFRMGARGQSTNEQPVHTVQLTVPFYLAETPVTQAQYRVLARGCLDELQAIEGNMGIEPSQFSGDDRPVEQVIWDEAGLVARHLSRSGALKAAGFPVHWRASLPSEAQWEYACRAGTRTEYWRGDGEAALAEVGWYSSFAEGGNASEIVDVAQKPANAFGLFDMHGNVWEWCHDGYAADAYLRRGSGGIDPISEPSSAPNRVLRGGSWIDSSRFCRSAYRSGRRPGVRLRGVGFRLLVSPGPLDDGPTESGHACERVEEQRGEATDGTEGVDPVSEASELDVIDLSEVDFPAEPERKEDD